MNHDAEVSALATLKRFLIDSEIPVRELAELAFANWIAARSFCADERERSEWALLADLILKRGRKIVESWTAATSALTRTVRRRRTPGVGPLFGPDPRSSRSRLRCRVSTRSQAVGQEEAHDDPEAYRAQEPNRRMRDKAGPRL